MFLKLPFLTPLYLFSYNQFISRSLRILYLITGIKKIDYTDFIFSAFAVFIWDVNREVIGQEDPQPPPPDPDPCSGCAPENCCDSVCHDTPQYPCTILRGEEIVTECCPAPGQCCSDMPCCPGQCCSKQIGTEPGPSGPMPVFSYDCCEAAQDQYCCDEVCIGVASLSPDDGTEFDDKDGDPNTKSFIVNILEDGEGVVTVTATPNPGMSADDLPSCWSLTGGDVQDKLHTEVDKAICGTTIVTCTARTSYKQITIYVCGGWLSLKASAITWPGLHGWWQLEVCPNCLRFVPTDLREQLSEAGYWPAGKDKALTEPGDVFDGEQGYTPTGYRVFAIPFTQLKMALLHVKDLSEDEDDIFDWLAHNCTHEACHVAQAGGVPLLTLPTPFALAEWLRFFDF